MSCDCVPHPSKTGFFSAICKDHAQLVAYAIFSEAQREREACAKIADGYGDALGSRDERDDERAHTGQRIAADIRDRRNRQIQRAKDHA
jgi:hypothetical protein